MKLSKEQIKEIAEELDMGMICYIHKETKAIKSMIDVDKGYDMDGWEDDLQEIQENLSKYVRIEPMRSNISFQIMEDFANQVGDRSLKIKLLSALNRKKPFRNFNFIIHDSGSFREEWFAYKLERYMEWVEAELEDFL